jgi:crossover junction endodeoxyribonuclease RuvC
VLIVGIDPGITGAIATLDHTGLLAVDDMPTMACGKGAGKRKRQVNAAGLSALLKERVSGRSDEVLVVLERVASMPGQGVAGVFSLGDTFGCIRGVVAAEGYPLELVTPQAWKKRFGLNSDKEQARAKSIELYPSAPLSRVKDHGRVEAILIARYGWEVFGSLSKAA